MRQARTPTVSVVIPTRARPAYLAHALDTLMRQVLPEGEVVVVCDGPDARSASVAREHGAQAVELPAPEGLNRARNAGIDASRAPLIVFIDDDVEVPDGWLSAVLAGAAAYPGHDVFGGPISPRLEGRPLPVCGRERPPITSLDLGPVDRDARLVWGANMAVRASAFGRLGGFDPALSGAGDEEEWLRRYAASGGRIRYLARAGLVHRRCPRDATLVALSRAAYARGRGARAHDHRRRAEPPLGAEARSLAGCVWHTLRRRCVFGITMGAHAAGRLAGAVSER